MAVAPVVRLLQKLEDRIEQVVVLGPRPLVALAKLVARIASYRGAEFFSSEEEQEALRFYAGDDVQEDGDVAPASV